MLLWLFLSHSGLLFHEYWIIYSISALFLLSILNFFLVVLKFLKECLTRTCLSTKPSLSLTVNWIVHNRFFIRNWSFLIQDHGKCITNLAIKINCFFKFPSVSWGNVSVCFLNIVRFLWTFFPPHLYWCFYIVWSLKKVVCVFTLLGL